MTDKYVSSEHYFTSVVHIVFIEANYVYRCYIREVCSQHFCSNRSRRRPKAKRRKRSECAGSHLHDVFDSMNADTDFRLDYTLTKTGLHLVLNVSGKRNPEKKEQRALAEGFIT